MRLFGKAFKDLTDKVKALEEKEKSDDNKEIREIIETKRIIDELILGNAYANYQASGNKNEVEMPAKKSSKHLKRKRCMY
jgi:hypothetical protein